MEGEVPREVNTSTHRGRKLASGAPLDAPGGTGSGLLTAQGRGPWLLWPEGRPRRCRYVARGLLTWPAVAIEQHLWRCRQDECQLGACASRQAGLEICPEHERGFETLNLIASSEDTERLTSLWRTVRNHATPSLVVGFSCDKPKTGGQGDLSSSTPRHGRSRLSI